MPMRPASQSEYGALATWEEGLREVGDPTPLRAEVHEGERGADTKPSAAAFHGRSSTPGSRASEAAEDRSPETPRRACGGGRHLWGGCGFAEPPSPGRRRGALPR